MPNQVDEQLLLPTVVVTDVSSTTTEVHVTTSGGSVVFSVPAEPIFPMGYSGTQRHQEG